MRKIVSLDYARDARWRQHCLDELAKRWRMTPEQILDTLLLEAYLQMVIELARPRVKDDWEEMSDVDSTGEDTDGESL
ncbi:hypothetical protein [Acidithiobacillus sp. AMEEHan]|uniref:hypothetical protein n=1 Tax=Acidithiobacillus sp. AMEEHan TaxID=2994951 RepID=UPI0027E3B945|nr:hypothetical protein [Acidithiobacillus sp. AMEEHan]